MSGVNKIIFGDETLLDISEDTVSPYRLLKGYKAHTADGTQVDGLYDPNATSILTTRKITVNGTYEADDDRALGYSEVTVNVPGTFYKRLIEKNGTYKAEDEDADGFSQIRVDTEEVEPWEYITTIDEVVQERDLDFVKVSHDFLMPIEYVNDSGYIDIKEPDNVSVFANDSRLYIIYTYQFFDYETYSYYYNNIIYFKDQDDIKDFEKMGEFSGSNREVYTLLATYYDNKIHIIAEDHSIEPTITFKHYSVNNDTFELTEESTLPYDTIIPYNLDHSNPSYYSMISYNGKIHTTVGGYDTDQNKYFIKHYIWDGSIWSEAAVPSEIPIGSRSYDCYLRLFIGDGLNCVGDKDGDYCRFIWKYDDVNDTWTVVFDGGVYSPLLFSSKTVVYQSIPNEYSVYLNIVKGQIEDTISSETQNETINMIAYNTDNDGNYGYCFANNISNDMSMDCDYCGISVGSTVYFIPTSNFCTSNYYAPYIFVVKRIKWDEGENLGWVNTRMHMPTNSFNYNGFSNGDVVYNNKIYMTSYTGTLYEIDMTNDRVTAIATLPIEKKSSGTKVRLVQYEGIFHIFTIDTSNNPRHLAYEIATNNWTIDASVLPFSSEYNSIISDAGIIAHNDGIHILGGNYTLSDGDEKCKLHYYYDGNSWNVGEQLPYRYIHPIGYNDIISYNGAIHVLGFHYYQDGNDGKHYKYVNGSWEFVENVPFYDGVSSGSIIYLCVGVYNNKIGILRVLGSGDYKKICVYVFNEETVTWDIENTYDYVYKYNRDNDFSTWFYQMDNETLYLMDMKTFSEDDSNDYYYLIKNTKVEAYPKKYKKTVYKLLQDSQEES